VKQSQQNPPRVPKILNAEEIAARRIPLEDAEINLGKIGNWYCHYCTKRFATETTFMKHFCEPRRRAQELLSPVGQTAYGFYREWMRQKKFSQPSSAAFLESKYYRAFINFSELVVKANISNPNKFISLMVEGNILPILWCRDSAYALYLDWSDKISDPLDQVQDSISYLIDTAGKEKVDLREIFTHLGPNTVLSLIRQRRLTPWLLFCSTSFGAFLKTLDMSQLKAFNQVVNSAYWAERFKTEKAAIDNIKHIAKEMGL
jgi:hypothetical protein